MFEIGQQVVCIEDWPLTDATYISHTPIKGQIYTIRGFCKEAMDIYDVPYIYLEELINPIVYGADTQCEPAFLGLNFRPVRKTSIEVFTSLLVPSPKQKVLT